VRAPPPALPLRGPRVILREWRDSDRAPWAALNADPEVRRFFFATLTRAEADSAIDRYIAHQEQHGFGFWALEIPGLADCAGFVGMQRLYPHEPFSPGVEIGWRLARAAWGHGYATEAARLCVDFAFGPAGLPELLGITARLNLPSQRVMQRLGMVFDQAFDHPDAPAGHELAPHLLYRLARPAAV
jgi:ribosomal-protein-alanine N-acetyltransferase